MPILSERTWSDQTTVRFRALPLLLLLFAGCSGGGSAVYTIGAAGPWQLSNGKNTRLGIALALKEINDAGGIDGHTLVIKEVDDEADGRKAAKVAQDFVNDASISAVIGHVTSGAMVAAAKVYHGHLPALATSASSPDLTGISPWAFRVIASDSANAEAMARFATQTGHTRVAILYENDNYGRGLAYAFRRNYHGTVVSMDPIAAGAPRADVSIAYFKDVKPDLVFVAGIEASGVALLTEAKRQGLVTDWMGGSGWTPLTAHADIAEGAYVGAPFAASDPRPEAQKFVAAYKAAYGGAEPNGNAALGYDAAKTLAAALAAVGPDRTRIREWLATLKAPLAGATGPIRFQATGDPTANGLTMTRITQSGTLVIAGGAK
jgi:branched-chain amino acid transport system substrate-binding protein